MNAPDSPMGRLAARWVILRDGVAIFARDVGNGLLEVSHNTLALLGLAVVAGLIFMGGTPIGSPAIGWFAENFGVRITVFICGVIVLVAALAIAIIIKRSPGPEPKTESLPVITDPQN